MVIVLVPGVGSLLVVVQGILGVPLSGPLPLLIVMVIIPVIMLSGGFSAIESQPDTVQRLTFLLASHHFIAFAKAVAFRGAGLAALWLPLAMMIGLGSVFLLSASPFFRRPMSMTG